MEFVMNDVANNGNVQPVEFGKGLRIPSLLYEHQYRAIRWAMVREQTPWHGCKGGFLSLETGLGKTMVILVLIYLDRYSSRTRLNPNKKPTIVVCGLEVMKEWNDAIEEFFEPGTFRVMIVGDKGKDYREQDFYNYDIVFINYEKLGKIFTNAVKEVSQKCITKTAEVVSGGNNNNNIHNAYVPPKSKSKPCNRIIVPPKRDWDEETKSSPVANRTTQKKNTCLPRSSHDWAKWIESKVVFAPLYPKRDGQEVCVLCNNDYLSDSRSNLFKVRWARVVCDEAHEIRSSGSNKFMGCIALHSDGAYWAVTASPMQNKRFDFLSIYRLVRFIHPEFIRTVPSPTFETNKDIEAKFYRNVNTGIMLYRNKEWGRRNTAFEYWPKEVMEIIKDKDPKLLSTNDVELSTIINESIAELIKIHGEPAFELGTEEDRVDELSNGIKSFTRLNANNTYTEQILEKARLEHANVTTKQQQQQQQQITHACEQIISESSCSTEQDICSEMDLLEMVEMYERGHYSLSSSISCEDSMDLEEEETVMVTPTNSDNEHSEAFANDFGSNSSNSVASNDDIEATLEKHDILGTDSSYYILTSDFATEQEKIIYDIYNRDLNVKKEKVVSASTLGKRKRTDSVVEKLTGNPKRRKEDTVSRFDIFACFAKLREACIHPLLSLITEKTNIKKTTRQELDMHNKQECLKVMQREWEELPPNIIEELYDVLMGKYVTTKMMMIRYYIKNFVKEGEKITIYSNFRDALTYYAKFLKEEMELGCMVYSGEKSAKERKRLKKMFNTDPNCRVMLGNMKMCANGMNLQVANHALILDPWWNPEVERQALDRIDRINQTRHQNKVYLLIRGTAEENVHKVGTFKCQDIYMAMGKTAMKDRMMLLQGDGTGMDVEKRWNLTQINDVPTLEQVNARMPIPIVFEKGPWKLFVFSEDREAVIRSMEDSNYDYYTVKLENGKTINASNCMEIGGKLNRKSNREDKNSIESMFRVILSEIKT